MVEARNEARHARDGLELPEKTIAELRAEAPRLGVGWPDWGQCCAG